MGNHSGNSTKPRPIADRFWAKVDASGDCWEWVGAVKSNGYGNFCPTRTKTEHAHRFAWQLLVGPIPEGLVIDHLCRNRRCVNPNHLRVVSQRVNTLCSESVTARNARKTHCAHGHPLAGDNLRVTRAGTRQCILCTRRARRARTERARAARAAMCAVEAERAEGRAA